MSEEIIYSFPPVVKEGAHTLILGSMPGVTSLTKSQYYGHPSNAFWRIICSLLKTECPDSYDLRLQLLTRNRIALWDVLQSCTREGSLDTKIRNEDPNDFPSFFLRYPEIRRVFFNGSKAMESFRRHFGFDFPGVEFIKLPSTSPAYTIPFEEKLVAWRLILSKPYCDADI